MTAQQEVEYFLTSGDLSQLRGFLQERDFDHLRLNFRPALWDRGCQAAAASDLASLSGIIRLFEVVFDEGWFGCMRSDVNYFYDVKRRLERPPPLPVFISVCEPSEPPTIELQFDPQQLPSLPEAEPIYEFPEAPEPPPIDLEFEAVTRIKGEQPAPEVQILSEAELMFEALRNCHQVRNPFSYELRIDDKTFKLSVPFRNSIELMLLQLVQNVSGSNDPGLDNLRGDLLNLFD